MAEQIKPQVIAVVGPTASGKTTLSVKIAKLLNAEVVSADSMQIYKGMDIATAKPTVDEMQGITHHLIDFLPADKEFSVASYVDLAHKAITEISAKGKVAVVAGGTGLYVDNLLSGTRFSEGETDFRLRKELKAQLDSKGLDALLDELRLVDNESYEKLCIERNPKRIMRALEIYKSTGITMSEQNKLSKPTEAPYNHIKIGLDFNSRQSLYDRINLRVDMMLEAGLLQECENFFSSNIGNTAVQAIGYKELEPFFRGEADLEECVESLKRATRRYAKRQLTWFRRDTSTKWFYVDNYADSDQLFMDVKDFLISKGFDL